MITIINLPIMSFWHSFRKSELLIVSSSNWNVEVRYLAVPCKIQLDSVRLEADPNPWLVNVETTMNLHELDIKRKLLISTQQIYSAPELSTKQGPSILYNEYNPSHSPLVPILYLPYLPITVRNLIVASTKILRYPIQCFPKKR